jgi:hypothetical protein
VIFKPDEPLCDAAHYTVCINGGARARRPASALFFDPLAGLNPDYQATPCGIMHAPARARACARAQLPRPRTRQGARPAAPHRTGARRGAFRRASKHAPCTISFFSASERKKQKKTLG